MTDKGTTSKGITTKDIRSILADIDARLRIDDHTAQLWRDPEFLTWEAAQVRDLGAMQIAGADRGWDDDVEPLIVYKATHGFQAQAERTIYARPMIQLRAEDTSLMRAFHLEDAPGSMLTATSDYPEQVTMSGPLMLGPELTLEDVFGSADAASIRRGRSPATGSQNLERALGGLAALGEGVVYGGPAGVIAPGLLAIGNGWARRPLGHVNVASGHTRLGHGEVEAGPTIPVWETDQRPLCADLGRVPTHDWPSIDTSAFASAAQQLGEAADRAMESLARATPVLAIPREYLPAPTEEPPTAREAALTRRQQPQPWHQFTRGPQNRRTRRDTP